MVEPALPLPPPDLAARVGTPQGEDPLGYYLAEGARLRGVLDDLLGPDWRWEGKRILDFGCGSARVLRHFAPEAARAEFWGCDIHAESIGWDRDHLSPPFRFLHSAAAPPLDLPPGSLDLVWATSVFTHIDELWSAWLLELHRLLAPGGTLVATFLGEGMWEALTGEPYRGDEVGMTVLRHWEGPDAWVFHSEWWLREHWGRAFDVVDVRRPPRGSDGRPEPRHSFAVLRRRGVAPSRHELERLDPAEPRELAALQTSLRLARRELEELADGRWPTSPRELREAILRSPLGPPARRLRRRLRAAVPPRN